MLPLTVVQYVLISLWLAWRVFVVAMESMVTGAMIFLCSSRAYTTLLCSTFYLKGKRQVCMLVVSIFMMHSAILALFCLACLVN